MKQPWKRYSKVFLNLSIAGLVLFFCISVVPRILVFFLPFVVGWIIALIANPLVRVFEEKLKIRRRAGSAVVIVVVITLVLLVLYLLITSLAEAFLGFVSTLPALWQTLEEDFREIGQNLSVLYDGLPAEAKDGIFKIGQDMDGYIARIVGEFGTPTVSAVGNFAKNIPGALIHVIMGLLASYFFIAEKEEIAQFWQRCIPASIRDKWRIAFDSLKNAVGGYFKAQLKIELLIFLLLLIGFLLLRIPYAPLIAFLTAVLDFLPFFGTGAVMLPWALLKFLSADYEMAIWLLVIWGVGQLVRQIIQPKIVGDSVGIAPLPTLVLLFVGYKLAGVLGMILAIPIGIILINLNKAGIFDTIKMSLRILVAGINRFRRFDEEDQNILPPKEQTGQSVPADVPDREMGVSRNGRKHT